MMEETPHLQYTKMEHLILEILQRDDTITSNIFPRDSGCHSMMRLISSEKLRECPNFNRERYIVIRPRDVNDPFELTPSKSSSTEKTLSLLYPTWKVVVLPLPQPSKTVSVASSI